MTDRDPSPTGESDAPADDQQVMPEGEGGEEQPDAGDRYSTTGTTPNDEYVGRVAGHVEGEDIGESGAERRAAAGGQESIGGAAGGAS